MIGDWNNLADYIKNKYNNYNAFIIIVNNNTIVYTACAISFMIENLSKPIIFSNGNDLATTLVLASQTKIPEVMISINNKLYRAVLNIFELSDNNCLTYNYQTPNITYVNSKLIIPIIKVFPGIDEKYMKSFVDNKNIHGIILEVWSEGSAPTNEGFLKSLKQITSKGVIILCVSHCDKICELDIRLLDAGCLDGGDMTVEAAYAKLVFLLSNIPDKKMIGKLIEISFRGELLQK
jgi:L-asparaginase